MISRVCVGLLALNMVFWAGCSPDHSAAPPPAVLDMVEDSPPLVAYRRERQWLPRDGREEANGIFTSANALVHLSGREIRVTPDHGDQRVLSVDSIAGDQYAVYAEVIGDTLLVQTISTIFLANLSGELIREVAYPRTRSFPDFTIDPQGRIYIPIIDSSFYLVRLDPSGSKEYWGARPFPEDGPRDSTFVAYNRVEFAAGRIHLLDIDRAEMLAFDLTGELREIRRMPMSLREAAYEGVWTKTTGTSRSTSVALGFLKRTPTGSLFLPVRSVVGTLRSLMGLIIDPEDLSFRRIDLDSLPEAAATMPSMPPDMAIRGDSILVVSRGGNIYSFPLAEAPVRPDPRQSLPKPEHDASAEDMLGCYEPELLNIWGPTPWTEMVAFGGPPGPLEIVWLEPGSKLGIRSLGWTSTDPSFSPDQVPSSPLQSVEGDSLEGRIGSWHGARFRLARGVGDLGGRVWPLSDPGEHLGPFWVRLREMNCPGG